MSNKSVYEILIAKESVNCFSIFLQFLILIYLGIISICSIVLPILSSIMYLLLGFTFFIMTYNNYRFFKRKGVTVVYLGMGFFFFFISGLMIFGK